MFSSKDFEKLCSKGTPEKTFSRRRLDATNLRDLSPYEILGIRRNADVAAIKKCEIQS